MTWRDDDEPDDREMPDPSDQDSFDEPGVMPCPHCRQLISEDAEQCEHCHQYISVEDAPVQGKPWWVWAGLIGLAAVLLMWLM